MILAIAAAFVAGSIATGTIVFADDDDDGGSLLCDAGKAMTGILFDDDDITGILCGAQLQGPEGPPGADGADGAPGADGTDLNFYQVTTIDNNNNFAIALCDPLDTVVGGGGTGADGFGPDAAGTGPPLPLITSLATQQGNQQGWIATAQLVAGNTGAHAFAICADTNP